MDAAFPIDPYLGEIIQAVKAGGPVIVRAAPGAGKTTRLPLAVLRALAGRVLVLEPRRLAARLAANFVAEMLGEKVGGQVGYQVRFDNRLSANSRLIYMTEGIFIRRMLQESERKDLDCLIIDEFHERHIDTDVALALGVRLMQSVGLRLVIMSATLDTAGLEAYLGAAQVFDIPGRTFPVSEQFLPALPAESLPDHVARATAQLIEDPRCIGDILVFLPGTRDIRHAQSTVEARLGGRIEVLPLTAQMPAAEQQRVFATGERRKVILATNVAESSVTIPGIGGVVDSGLAKIAASAAWSGLPLLETRRVSRASLRQRAGRAGRNRPGLVLRLFDEADFLSREAYSQPEIARLDLSPVLLQLLAQFAVALPEIQAHLAWFEPPPAPALAAAGELLLLIGAVDGDQRITPAGQRMARTPLHPRLAAMVLAAERLGCLDEALMCACLISENLFPPINAFFDLTRHTPPRQPAAAAARAYGMLAREFGAGEPVPPPYTNSRLPAAALQGFPDRVARRQAERQQGWSYHLCRGGSGILTADGNGDHPEFVIVLGGRERPGGEAQLSIGIPVSRETLLASHSPLLQRQVVQQLTSHSLLREREETRWGQCLISERTCAPSSAAEWQRQVLERWPFPFPNTDPLTTYHRKADLIERVGLATDWPRFTGEMLELFIASICDAAGSIKELQRMDLSELIVQQLSPAAAAALARFTPDHYQCGRRRLPLEYAQDTVRLSGYIQDFYGLGQHPTILADRLPLTVTLLAPNRRPVQTTNDLPGFWRRHYPALKSSLQRRYPRHYWPDDPEHAEPRLLNKR